MRPIRGLFWDVEEGGEGISFVLLLHSQEENNRITNRNNASATITNEDLIVSFCGILILGFLVLKTEQEKQTIRHWCVVRMDIYMGYG
ncbi:MAG: hypothetical protein ACI90V_005434 [Bacillariaceae sp.]